MWIVHVIGNSDCFFLNHNVKTRRAVGRDTFKVGLVE